MTSGEFVALLEDYAGRYGLPVETGTPVTDLVASGGLYRLALPRGPLWARNVVIASSNQNCPARPPFFALLPPKVQQIDASAYRNASGLDSGAVLVVGSAQSGGQIAEDLVQAGELCFLQRAESAGCPECTEAVTSVSGWFLAD
jgi:putative flavoprotein involved in K+ transport